MIFGMVLALSATLHAAEVSVADKGHAFNPAWSPDGQWVAFELNKYQGSIDLYVVKVMNGNPVGAPQKVSLPGGSSQFASGGSVATAPTWLPQGMVIFEGSSTGKDSRLFFWKPGGQGAGELLSTAQVTGDLSWPTVSPDGKVVTFVSDVTGSGDLYGWDRGTNKVTMLLTSPFTESAPRYNADGSKLAFSRKNQGGEDLFVLSGGAASSVMGGNGDQTRPIWVGSNLVYFTDERGQDRWDIAVSTGPGTKVVIAKDVRLPHRAPPAITPDGKWVVYGVSTPEAADQIFFTTLDGARTVKVAAGLVACGEPSVAKVGDRLFLAFTALPGEGADWRQLHVVDVTDQLK